eukprot:NODE_330_length_10876_cov_0.359840.p6 type:complete len:158 gc:universal NODE_330_length_10876_cov_0.359840:10785-10312(-)
MTFFTSLFIAFCTSVLSEGTGYYFVFGTPEYKLYQKRISNIEQQKKKSKVAEKDLRHYTFLSSRMQFKSVVFTSIILFLGYNFINGHVVELPFQVPFFYLQKNLVNPTPYQATDLFIYFMGMAVFKSVFQKLLNTGGNMQNAFKLAQVDFEKKWNEQ